MNLKNRTEQLTDEELEELICELEAAGFYRRQLLGLTELQERRKAEANNKPVLPEIIPRSVFYLIYEQCGGFVECAADPQAIWDACRDVMLKGGEA